MRAPPNKWVQPLIGAALIGLGLAGCSTTTTPSGSAPSSGAPLPMAGYDWHLNEDGTEASLSYGMAETDDVPFDLSCHRGRQQLTLFLNTDKYAAHSIQLESGGETETYSAQAEASALSDGIDLTATAPLTDPVFKRFQQVGWLAVYSEKQRRTLVATEAARPQIQRFFELCSR